MKKVIRLTESDLKRIVKCVLNEEETDESTPTGVVDSEGTGRGLILDKNSSLGILDGEYRLYREEGWSEYNTTKKIPDGKYRLILVKNIDGFNVKINTEGFNIKNENPVEYSWSDLFSKLNKVSLNSSNNLLSDEDDIFQSLLQGSVPCFELDKESENFIRINNNDGIIIDAHLYLKSKCDKNITLVYIWLDNNETQSATVYGSDTYTADVVWDGNNLSFPKIKSGESKLIIKVNESIRKVLRSYFL